AGVDLSDHVLKNNCRVLRPQHVLRRIGSFRAPFHPTTGGESSSWKTASNKMKILKALIKRKSGNDQLTELADLNAAEFCLLAK
ncbi:hypothetical protein LINPERHAP1_LOCUS34134, partial [Linum perenne]